MRRMCLALAIVMAAPAVAPALASGAADDGFEVVADRVVLTVRSGVELAPQKSDGLAKVGIPALDALADRFAVHGVQPLYGRGAAKRVRDEHAQRLERVYTVDFDPQRADVQSVLAAYRALDAVAEADPVHIYRQTDGYLPDDPEFLNGSQWYLRNTVYGGGTVKPIGAWAAGLADSSVIVAVIDSGVDWHHPDLGGTHPDRVNGVIWTNWAEYNGTPGVDDDGNGFVDDIRGWDFVDVYAGAGWPDEDDVDEDNDPMDYGGHGTMVSGCVTALTNNGQGIAGTAPGCKVMALRAGWLPDGETGGVLRTDFISAAMVYAADNGAKIINASWTSSSIIASAVDYVQARGVLIVTAAGNDNTSSTDRSYLGTRAGVMAVAATDRLDRKSSFSNFGSWVEIAAPGEEIYTTYYNRNNGNSGYIQTQGTSFASPIAAGAAALVWSAFPAIPYTAVIDTLTAHADDIDAVNPGYVGLLGAGRVNLARIFSDGRLEIPREYVEIEDALQEADSGDEIAVRGGDVYSEWLLPDKALQVLGGYDAAYSTRDPVNDPTILRGAGSGPALEFATGVTATTVVDGFRCEQGIGKVLAGIPQGGRYGGGVIVRGASPVLRNLEVTNNSVGQAGELGGGGGLVLVNSTALLENVHVHGNSGIYGAGVYVYGGAPVLRDCRIADNTPIQTNSTYPPKGGGLYVISSNPTLENVQVEGHNELVAGGGVFVGTSAAGPGALTMRGGTVAGSSARDSGGGIHMTGGGALVLENILLQSNTRTAASSFMSGGAVYVSGGTVALDSLTVIGCTAHSGAGIHVSDATEVVVTNSVFHGNGADVFGGAIVVQNAPAGELRNNTVAYNSAVGTGGAGFAVTSSTLGFSHNLAVFNTGGTGIANGAYISGGSVAPSCNDVFDNTGADWGGVADPTGSDGNIAADPRFCDVAGFDLRLESTSPCAPDQSGGCGLIGALDVGCAVDSVEDDGIPTAFRVDQNFPNPFNPQTTIRFALPERSRTTVTIYDVAGRAVRRLLAEELGAAVHQVQWNGRDDRGQAVAAGVYFYRVASDEHLFVGRMALVK
ncbi:MAG: S8 family serine peptidase [Candidatus Krumholzibacteriia bacterium]